MPVEYPLLVYVTCKSADEARSISQALLDERLVACANILPGAVESLYLWQGKREHSQETAVIFKTMPDRFQDLNRTVRRLHSYQTPCVVALPLVMGDAEFLAWIKDSTRPHPSY